MTDAADRGWGKGWPTDRRDDMVTLKVGAVDFPGGVHRDIAPLMEILLEESIARGYVKLRDGWCWGYASRPIKRSDGSLTDVPSNHSWGLAVDVNAPVNCFGCSTHAIPEAMGHLWVAYGFQWGGFYSTTKDWMHFEFIQTPAQAANAIARAREEFMEDERLDQLDKGFDAYRDRFKENGGVDPGPPPEGRGSWFDKGWAWARFAALNPHGE